MRSHITRLRASPDVDPAAVRRILDGRRPQQVTTAEVAEAVRIASGRLLTTGSRPPITRRYEHSALQVAARLGISSRTVHRIRGRTTP